VAAVAAPVAAAATAAAVTKNLFVARKGH